MSNIPAGAPHFNMPGSWDAYIRWNLLVPCKGCGIRKIDNPRRYGLQPDPKHPKYWVTEEWCNNCWWNSEERKNISTAGALATSSSACYGYIGGD